MIEILAEEEEDTVTGKQIENAHLPIQLDRVSFGYKPDQLILKEISAVIEAGKVTAIASFERRGKTTLFKLLERFYTPTAGPFDWGTSRSILTRLNRGGSTSGMYRRKAR